MGFRDEIEELILNGDYEEAKLEILKESNTNFVEQDGMNLMTKVFDIGLRTACTQEQIEASTEILCHLTSVMSPKEALITLLEQIEVVGLDHKLYCVLQPLQIALEKLPSKWEMNLEWILETLDKRVRIGDKPLELECHEREQVKLNELKAAEADEGCLQVQVYKPVEGFIKFYQYCLNHILTNVKDFDELNKWKVNLREKVFCLLGCLKLWPFRYPTEESRSVMSKVNLSVKSQEPAETQAFEVACDIVDLLEKLGTTVRYYHEWIHLKIDEMSSEKISKAQEKDTDEVENVPDIDLMALVSYFYIVYSNNLGGSHRSGPTAPTYELHSGLYLTSNLLAMSDNVEVHIKALSVVQFLLNQLCPFTSFHRLGLELLDTKVHEEFLTRLANAFTYSECPEVRRLGAFVFKSYLWAFNSPGRYKFIQSILNDSSYSDSIQGFIVTQLKEFVRQALEKLEGKSSLSSMGQDEPLLDQIEFYFTGKNLQGLVQNCVRLPSGPNTDLMSCDNLILATLNLVRFLLLRDGKKNLSGFAKLIGQVGSFLKDLRKAVDMTVMQAKGRLKELEDPEAVRREMSEAIKAKWDVVDSQGNSLQDPNNFSVEEQTASCHGVLSKMDLMECVLAHTNELCEAAVKE